MACKWFRTAPRRPGLESKAMDLLQPYFDSIDNNPINPKNTTHQTLPYDQDIPIEQIWNILLRLATAIPTSHPAIISLLTTLLPTPPQTQPKALTTSFTWAWSDYHEFLLTGIREALTPSNPTIPAWLNYNMFSAHCTNANLIDPTHALEHIVNALEKTLRLPIPVQKEIALRVAAQNFIYAGGFILRNPPRHSDGRLDTRWGDYSPAKRVGEGLSRARWGDWKGRWDEIRRMDGVELDGALVDLAARAYQAMEEAEIGMEW